MRGLRLLRRCLPGVVLLAPAVEAAQTRLYPLSATAPLPAVDFCLNEQGPFTAIVDTGNGTVGFAVAASLAAQLGLPAAAAAATDSAPAGVGGAAQLGFVRARRLIVAGSDQRDVVIGVTPAFDRLSALVNAPLNGNIGYGFLKSWRVRIDMPAARLALSPSAPGAAGTAFVLGAIKPLIVVPARLGSQSGQAVFDSGAGVNLISPGMARRLRLQPGAPYRVEGVAGGRDGRLARLDRLAIGGARLTGIEVVISDAVADIARLAGRPVDAVFGQQLMAGAAVTIDYPARRLHVEPAASSALSRRAAPATPPSPQSPPSPPAGCAAPG